MKSFREWLNENTNIPKINTPANVKDLELLFDEINKKYFNNKLQKPKIKFAPLAKNYYGKAHVNYTPEGVIKQLLITISSKIKTDENLLVNVMGHEIIHIWQFIMNESEKTRKYTNATTEEIFGSSDKHMWGHNKYFIEHMLRLNNLGFNIEVASDAPTGVELTVPVYFILLNKNILLWNANDITDHMEKIISNIENKLGIDISNYTIYKTLESNITLSTRLTKEYELPKNVLNIKYNTNFIEDIVNSELTTLIKNNNVVIKDNKNVQKEIKELLPQISKYRSSSFETFFKTCWLNAFPELSKIPGNQLYTENKEINSIKIPNKLSISDAEYIFEFWKDISDNEIKKSDKIKYFFTDLKFMIMKKSQNLNSINNLLNYYESDLKERVDFNRFKKIVSEVLINEIKKEFKKSGKTYDENYLEVLNHFLKGTKLEGVLK